MATDKDGNVYVTGTTSSLDFPVKSGFQKKIGGAFLRTTQDNGKTWSMPEIGEAVYAAASSAKAPGVIYVGTNGGLYKSTDGLKSFSALNTGFEGAVVNALVVDAQNPASVYAATSHGFYRSVDAGASWLRTKLDAQMSALAAGSSSLYLLSSQGIIYKSTDAGATWAALTTAPNYVFSLAADPAHPNVVYAGVPAYVKGGIYRSNDGGETWAKVSSAGLSGSTFELAASPTAVYAATNAGVLLSRDSGTTWTATNLTASADNVAVDPNNPLVAYANAGGIWITSDGGTTWTSVLPVRQFVQTIAVLPTVPATVAIGAESSLNVFVTKWSADGTQMLYSTYLGGSFWDYSTGIAVDLQGNAYVTGYTYSTDFPVSQGAAQMKSAGSVNGFVAKISADGTALAYSTYLGGSNDDRVRAIALDSNGSAYVTGQASSADFPITFNGAQPKLQTGCANPIRVDDADAFVVKLSPDGTSLRYSTFLGGSCVEDGTGIAVDPSGNAWVVGSTSSVDFPVRNWKPDPGFVAGKQKGFLAKLTTLGTDFSHAALLGNADTTSATGVAVDAKGNVYVSGATFGFDESLFPGLGEVPSICYRGSGTALSNFICSEPTLGIPYVLKLNPTGSSRVYLKYIADNFATPHSIAVDVAGRAWVSGALAAYNPQIPRFPLIHPFQAFGEGFLGEVSADGANLLFSSRMESSARLALDAAGNAFVSGSTGASAFYKYFYPSALVVRVDGAVASAITVEPPQPTVAKLHLPSDSDARVAPGEIVILAGTGMGPAQEVTAQLTAQGKVPTSLGGTSVLFDGIAAPLLSVQDRRVVCIVPFAVGKRQSSTTLQVESGGSKSNAILLGASSVAIEVLAIANQDGAVNSASKPAAPGSVITIYTSGYGDTDPPSKDGTINGSDKRVPLLDSNVKFGDQMAEVLYAGPAPGQVAGITQINIRVPSIAAGMYPVYLGWNSSYSYEPDYNPALVTVGGK